MGMPDPWQTWDPPSAGTYRSGSTGTPAPAFGRQGIRKSYPMPGLEIGQNQPPEILGHADALAGGFALCRLVKCRVNPCFYGHCIVSS